MAGKRRQTPRHTSVSPLHATFAHRLRTKSGAGGAGALTGRRVVPGIDRLPGSTVSRLSGNLTRAGTLFSFSRDELVGARAGRGIGAGPAASALPRLAMVANAWPAEPGRIGDLRVPLSHERTRTGPPYEESDRKYASASSSPTTSAKRA
jgi:hypothetical protein